MPFFSHPLTARHINRVNPGYQMTSCPLSSPDSPADVLHAHALLMLLLHAPCFFHFDFDFDSRSYPLCWVALALALTALITCASTFAPILASSACSYAVAVLRSGD